MGWVWASFGVLAKFAFAFCNFHVPIFFNFFYRGGGGFSKSFFFVSIYERWRVCDLHNIFCLISAPPFDLAGQSLETGTEPIHLGTYLSMTFFKIDVAKNVEGGHTRSRCPNVGRRFVFPAK